MPDITYPFTLMKLPYSRDAFGDFISPETIDYHYGKHHQGYVNNLNDLIKNHVPHLAEKSLEEIIVSCAPTSIKNDISVRVYNNAAQVWNHNFFWMSITPRVLDNTQFSIFSKIIEQYGSWETFVKTFLNISLSQFGSCWVWLMKNINSNNLEILGTQNAHTGFENSIYRPLFVCDVWEHAYYVDYRNDRKSYVKSMLDKYLNWEFIEKNYHIR